MRKLLPTLLPIALPLLASAAVAQDVLYYKFDETAGNRVVNYASRSGLAPHEGVITSTDTSAFAPGILGASALRGSATGGTAFHSFVDTGWNGSFSGSFSLAFFLKARNNPTSANYLCGNTQSGSFRCFTGGAVPNNIRVTSAGTTPLNLDMNADIRTPAATRWVHVALVVDSSTMTAIWYLDGLPQTTIPISVAPNVTTTTNFRVGAQNSTTTASQFDLDEFRFQLAAASPGEVLAWSRTTSARAARYGAGCGATLDSAGGEPTFGNNAFALTLQGAPASPFAVSLGTSRVQWNATPLPLDLGLLFPTLTGCRLESNLTIALSAATSGAGAGSIPLPIPNDPSMSGFTLWCQAFGFGPTLQTTNGLAVGL